MPTNWPPLLTTSTNLWCNTVATQTIVTGMPFGAQIIFGNSSVFIPLGSGTLYYHAIPNQTASTIGLSNWQSYQRIVERPRPLQRPAILSGRRALRRSIELFCRLRPEEEIRTFLSGKPLIVRGHRFDYRMQKRDDVLRHTINPFGAHIPYSLSVLDKASQRQLASGCVVIAGTPVIDQLLAVILHVQDPEEEMVVIRRTNWSADMSRHLHDLPMAA